MAMGIMAEGEYGDDMDNGYDSEEEFIDNTQFEDPEGFVDPMLEEELVGDILERRPMESDSLDMVIIVDNIPTVGPDRLGKLKNVIRKVFSRFGTVVNEFYPEENGKNKGYIFLEFSTAEEAAHAIKAANGYKLDKSHTFVVNSFSDFDKYKNVTEEWVPPEKKEYNDTSKLSSWLLEGDGNDYYAVVHSNNELSTHVGILKNGNTAPTLVCKRESWTEKYIAWSPKGTYMATFHEQGIALWGGKDMERLHKFNHTDVMLIDFSPCEKYIVTYSRDPPQENQAIIIWEIKTGLKKRGFMAGGNGLWPVFKWNHDGNMVARAVGENLSVYSIPSFGLLDKKSLKIPGLVDFSWSPTKNIIVYWVPENKDTPARLVIMDLPSRTEIRVKNLFNVQDCKMFWQKSGDFLCVKVDRLTKSKKRVYYNLELFRVNEKNIPVDTLEIKETIIAFDWEPNGNIFCVIHGEAPCIVSSFYQLEERELGNVMLIKTFDKRPANTICWAPTGQFCVLAGLRNLNGTLDFIDTADMSLMNDDEHFMATDIEWDATGRYLMTGVSWWAHKVENAYFIWSFQGKKLQTHAIPQFCHFSWRPRPPSLMTADDVARVKKELKKYQKQFELEDRRSQSKASKELLDKRRRLHTEFSEFRARHQQQFEETKKMRLELRDGMNTDSLQSEFDEFEEETVEFFVQELVEIIQSQAE